MSNNYTLADANQYYLIKDYHKAIELYNSLEPDYKTLTNRSMAYFRLKLYKESLKDCTSAIRLNPKNSKLWGRLGAVLNKLKKYEQSLIAYNKAINLCEDEKEVQIYLDMLDYINIKKLYESNIQLDLNKIILNMTKTLLNNPPIINKLNNDDFQSNLYNLVSRDKEIFNRFNNLMKKL